MAKRTNTAATIMNFFQKAPVETAQFAFDQIRDIMRERMPKKAKAPKKDKAV